MSFQAYLINIESKTGKNLEDFKILAEAKGFYKDGKLTKGTKPGAIVD